MKTIWQEEDLDVIIGYWSNGFIAKPGEKIVKVESLVDPVLKKVVFKIYVEEKPEEK